jgi:hypothetical protein
MSNANRPKLNGASGNVINLRDRKPSPSPAGSNAMRALWTFLFSTLVGPAIAAALLASIYIVSGVLNMGPPSLKTVKMAELPAYIALRTLDAYIWSAIPAAVTGLALAALVYARGHFTWIVGVVVAAIVASAWAFASGGQAMTHVSFITTIAAVTAILGRLALVAAKVAE